MERAGLIVGQHQPQRTFLFGERLAIQAVDHDGARGGEGAVEFGQREAYAIAVGAVKMAYFTSWPLRSCSPTSLRLGQAGRRGNVSGNRFVPHLACHPIVRTLARSPA